MSASKTYASENIRNLAILGHSQVGKTALADAILFNTGATTRLGRTQDKTSLFDLEPEEIHRGGSVTSHFGWVEHAGDKINLIDTPGDQNFFLDGLTALIGADSAVVMISAVDGVQVQTRRGWNAATERGLPRVIILNKMDRAETSWEEIIKQVGSSLDAQLVPIQVPIGSGEKFSGVVDLFTKKAYTWPADGSGKMTEGAVPADLSEKVEKALANLIDSVVSTDDKLLEAYLESGELKEEDLRPAFIKAVKANKLVPLLFTSASHNIGVQPFLDLVTTALPNPLERPPLKAKTKDDKEVDCKPDVREPFLAQVIHTFMDEHVGQLSILRVFSGELPSDGHVINAKNGEDNRLGSVFVLRGHERTKTDKVVCGDIISAAKIKNTHTMNTLCAAQSIRALPTLEYPNPMISLVLIPETKNDNDKLKEAVGRLIEEDPSLSLSIDDISHRMVLNGMGNSHVDNAIERMRRKFHVNVKTDLPTVSYRETFVKPINDIEGKHKKQSGGAGQFGVCFINVEPLPSDAGFEFVNKITGGAIPRQYIPSVEKGVVERTKQGMLAGYPVVDFRVTLFDGKYHPVDSKDIAFQMAGAKAIKIAMEKAGLKLLEPFHRMEIVIPSENSGDIMGDINVRRGQIEGMDTQGDMTVVRAICPQAEIQRYVADLHSMTQGKGTFTTEFDSYRDVPAHLVDKIRKESPFLKKEEDSDE